MYMVGGAVRDEILGVKSKDIDYTVVLEPDDFYIRDGVFSNDPFMVMVVQLESMGFKIFLETPEYLTVRAQFPKNHSDNAIMDFERGQTADFVLARKESEYTDGRRPDKVIPGTLEDDLARRDFTMNAIAKIPCPSCDGNGTANIGVDSVCGLCDGSGSYYIDPFNGRKDIEKGCIRTVGDPLDRLTEDALRAVRAIRFAVTKGFRIDVDLAKIMQHREVLDAIDNKISDERIKDELSKMFRYDTVASIVILNRFPALTAAMFSGNVSLDSTMKTKGRGK